MEIQAQVAVLLGKLLLLHHIVRDRRCTHSALMGHFSLRKSNFAYVRLFLALFYIQE